MNSYNQYIKRIKRKKLIILIMQLLLFISFIIIWQILASNNIINSFITSSPKNIVKTIISLYKNNNLTNHILTTIKETLISFSITTLLSLVISILLYSFNILAKIIDPYLTALNSLPKVALGPIIIICLGANTKSIIVMSIFRIVRYDYY